MDTPSIYAMLAWMRQDVTSAWFSGMLRSARDAAHRTAEGLARNIPSGRMSENLTGRRGKGACVKDSNLFGGLACNTKI
jgi:hypothetical protein